MLVESKFVFYGSIIVILDVLGFSNHFQIFWGFPTLVKASG
jgi:hypothetical protein